VSTYITTFIELYSRTLSSTWDWESFCW